MPQRRWDTGADAHFSSAQHYFQISCNKTRICVINEASASWSTFTLEKGWDTKAEKLKLQSFMFAIPRCGKLKYDIWVSVLKTILIISNAAPDIYDRERELTNLGGREREKTIPQQIDFQTAENFRNLYFKLSINLNMKTRATELDQNHCNYYKSQCVLSDATMYDVLCRSAISVLLSSSLLSVSRSVCGDVPSFVTRLCSDWTALSPSDWQDLAGGGTHSYAGVQQSAPRRNPSLHPKHRCKGTGSFPCAHVHTVHMNRQEKVHAERTLSVDTLIFEQTHTVPAGPPFVAYKQL